MVGTKPAILVAGGAGYIGSHTAKQLRKEGFEPVVIDNLTNGNRFALRYGPFYEGSIADRALLASVIEKHRIQGALLFAAHAYVGESMEHPRKYFLNNVAAALEFLEALLDGGVRRIVFSSSCSIYGIQAVLPIREDSSKNPLSPYAETKLFLEQVLERYATAYGVQSIALRYFNAAGADPEGEIGEHHDPETHLIPLAIYSAMGRQTLRVFGTDYETADGSAVRDYVHVTDLAIAHTTAMRILLDGGAGGAYNLGAGTGHSVLEVVRMVEKVSGRPVKVDLAPRRDGDAPALIADAARAESVLGWHPAFSSLENIVTTAWAWHQRAVNIGSG